MGRRPERKPAPWYPRSDACGWLGEGASVLDLLLATAHPGDGEEGGPDEKEGEGRQSRHEGQQGDEASRSAEGLGNAHELSSQFLAQRRLGLLAGHARHEHAG